MYPNGEAGRLMARLAWPCAHCGGAFHEPLTMAAKRHANDPRAVLVAFRALAQGGPTRGADEPGRPQGRPYMSATSARPYVGQGIPRLEDAALLRGEGRFMDDIDPVPHTRHAMIVRSPFAHARITSMDVRAAEALPGVIGVVTAEQIVAMSHPLPSGIQGGPAYYAAADRVARFMGEPVAVVVAESRYLAEDAADLIDIQYEPLEVEEVEVHERHFSYGAVDAAFAAADMVVESSFVFPRWSCTPVECYGVIADWRGDGLTAWANFQGPFTLHGVAAAALGIPAARLRLLDTARLGRLVRHQGGRVRVRGAARARLARSGRTRALDGGPTRAPGRERARERSEHDARGRLRLRRRAAGTALRRARGRRRLRPGARAGDALPDARLALRRLPRPERGRAQRRDRDEPLSDGSEPGLRRPAAVLPARTDDGHRRRAARTRSGRAATAQPRPRVPAHDAERRVLRRRRLPRLPRAGAGRGRLRRAPRRAGRRAPDRSRNRLHRRALRLEHGLHHARPDAGGACEDPAEVGERRGLHPHDRAARGDLGPHLIDTAGTGTSHGDRPDRRGQARRRARGRRGDRRDGHLDQRLVRRPRAPTRRASRASPRRPWRSRPTASPPRSRRSASTSARTCRCGASPGSATGTRSRCPRAWSPVSRRSPTTRRRACSRRTRTTAWPPLPRTASSSTSRSSRSTSAPARCASSST